MDNLSPERFAIERDSISNASSESAKRLRELDPVVQAAVFMISTRLVNMDQGHSGGAPLAGVDVTEQQREYLRNVIMWARGISEHLSDIHDRHRGRVHFRPSSGGVAMIGLLPQRPQRGRGGYKNLVRLAERFEDEFDRHCRHIDQGRPTPEKRLQSFLISEAYENGRLMISINEATDRTQDPAVLYFATDELALPIGGRQRVVCDLLALRPAAAGRYRPVVIELKSAREMKRLLAQVNAYAAVIEAHTKLFGELFSTLLGRDIAIESECERWIVWPALPSGAEPREQELAEKGVRVVSYVERDNGFDLRAFRSP